MRPEVVEDLLEPYLEGWPKNVVVEWPRERGPKSLTAALDALKRQGYALENFDDTHPRSYRLSLKREGAREIERRGLTYLIERHLEGMPQKLQVVLGPRRGKFGQADLIQVAVDVFDQWGYSVEDLRQGPSGGYTLAVVLKTEADLQRILRHWGSRTEDQTRRVYAAERRAAAGIASRRLNSHYEVSRYLDAITDSEWFKRRFGPVNVSVARKRHRWDDLTAAYANHESATITVVRKRPTELVALHELAHCLAPSRERHGPLFARVFVDLVERNLGAQASSTVEGAFRALAVKIGQRWYEP